MRKHISNIALALLFFVICGIAGAVETAGAAEPERDLAREVALQSWYGESKKARGVYCDMPKKKVAKLLKAKYNQKGKRIKRAYIYILKGC